MKGKAEESKQLLWMSEFPVTVSCAVAKSVAVASWEEDERHKGGQV